MLKRLSFILTSDGEIPGIRNNASLLSIIGLYKSLHALSNDKGSLHALFRKVEGILRVKERLQEEGSDEAEEKLANIEELEAFITDFDSTADDHSLGSFNAEVLLKRSSTDKSSVDKLDPSTVKLLTI